ncbi:bifunctional 23S rRNA (guanine(2069)-N(7))-methyltransferase RlmK/23S rRNA (guanine(2445)-N(2))-methyltransferase RlmL [uncultured Enorma sp.]|uniref:bifunctional 23S rRNA (guanine(2069)-N(7))-methyltransferase RlmK/23S rRNA (guanine(2445)-N(2))-methyltransferase RlmL n=1 Tax=uncultured Enorma sp. TaxID=1714346 RepID=UPI0025986F0D|nr:bifunctional 23S rRNA (guanine(2069)-N(7))-methyltransferase RlmK/23S rRNA (guanine(2445)-N(2))-methyltransferase RlmL [uncultured Enorma sp.]
MECYANCPAAFEQALADELRRLGIPRVRPLKGRVSFEGTARDAYRACLWSRLASRIHLVIGRFSCATADDLYHGVYELPWPSILKAGASIAVFAQGTNDALRNTRFSSLRAKDAIADRMVADTGTRPAVDTHAPDARLVLSVRGSRASLALDLSGEPLFKRIPRAALACAPRGVDILRPDYAALVLAESGWQAACAPAAAEAGDHAARRATADAPEDAPAAAREERTESHDAATAAHAEGAAQPARPTAPRRIPRLVDFACGEGGVLLEAAGMLANRAPGIARTRWGFQGWAQHDSALWRSLLADARAGMRDAGAIERHIVATDIDARAREAAERIVSAAGLAGTIAFAEPDARALIAQSDGTGARRSRRGGGRGRGAVLFLVGDTTPVPDSTAFAAAQLARELGCELAAQGVPTSTACLARTRSQLRMLASGAARQAEEATPSPIIHLTLGGDELVLGTAHEDPSSPGDEHAGAPRTAAVDVGDGKPIPLIIPESEQFARRLIKVARLRRRWAKRAGVTCYRVYDADLPDYSAAIDLYEGAERTPGRWLVVAEYAAPRTVDPERAQNRLLDMLAIAPRVLDVPPEHVHVKTRQRSRGGSQYGLQASPNARGHAGAEPVLIEEGGLTFAVEFGERLDTGIFLDHRLVRGLVREHARGARSFLNLFAYTGTATCYAADGGAAQTCTVDLSNTYLDWAEENMRLNGFDGRAHRFVRADVLAWVREQLRRGERWDLIFCDPPTFSNSARMGERTWDVQRDHVELLSDLAGLLAPGGEAIFSCNLRSFKPDVEALERAGVHLEDITEASIPEDFQRNKRIHHCYLVTSTTR